jgi:pimeloyl-ACP methyl ester carboxylesterase
MKEGISFQDIGNKEAPVLIFIHGLGLNQYVWQWQLPAFKQKFRLICFDLWGHGLSADAFVEPSLSLFVDQLRDVMDGLAIAKATLVGFSLGGMIARRAAQDMPERIERLILLNTAHKRTAEAQFAIEERVVQSEREGPDATVEAALLRWFTESYRNHNPEKMDLVRRWVLGNKKSVYHRNYRVLATGLEEIIAPDPPITCPTMVLTADQDYGNGPEMSKAIAEEIEGSELVILTGLRHMALMEDPEAVNQPMLDFLARSAL